MAPGADFAGFVEGTGTGGFTQLVDEDGSLWEQLGADDRSTFLFVDDSGSSERTAFGVVDEAELISRVEQLTAN